MFPPVLEDEPMSTQPDYLICVECDTPLYVFEWDEDHSRLAGAQCPVCGNDRLEDFQTEEDLSDGD